MKPRPRPVGLVRGFMLHFYTWSAPTARFGLLYRNILFAHEPLHVIYKKIFRMQYRIFRACSVFFSSTTDYMTDWNLRLSLLMTSLTANRSLKRHFFQFYIGRFFTYWPKNDYETTNQKGSSSGRFAVTNFKNDQSETKKGQSSDRCTVSRIIKAINSKIWLVAWLVIRAVSFEQITTGHLIGRFCGFCDRISGRTTCQGYYN